MKTKALFILVAGSLLALAVWFVHVPSNAQPNAEDGVPKKYRETIAKGLEYLANNQHKDGHWEGDDGKHPVAMTALVGMAFLMEGSTIDKGKYSANIRKAADWLISKSDPKRDGLFYSDHPSETDRYMYAHGLATQFLSWAYGNGTDPDKQRVEKVTKILPQATKYIAKAQSTRGGWYRTSKVEGHDLDEIWATAIQIQTLLMIRNLTEIPSFPEAVTEAQEYLRGAVVKLEKDAKPEQKLGHLGETAATLACLFTYKNDELCQKWFKRCYAEIPAGKKIQFGRDELLHYYYAQALLSESVNGNRESKMNWTSYRTATFDHLQSNQNKDGSWPGGDGICVGPAYSTAVWCTVLQLETKRHPLTRHRDLNTFTF